MREMELQNEKKVLSKSFLRLRPGSMYCLTYLNRLWNTTHLKVFRMCWLNSLSNCVTTCSARDLEAVSASPYWSIALALTHGRSLSTYFRNMAFFVCWKPIMSDIKDCRFLSWILCFPIYISSPNAVTALLQEIQIAVFYFVFIDKISYFSTT